MATTASEVLHEESWVLAVQGIVSLLFGIAAIFWPGLTIGTLVLLFSAYIVVMGIVSIFYGVTGISKRQGWIWTLLVGFLELAVGVYLVRNPNVVLATLVLLVGFILIARGIFDTVTAFTDDMPSSARVLRVIVGVLAFIAGIVVLRYPVASGIGFVWVVGLFALISGAVTLGLSLDFRRAARLAE
jgi:uncharacterized membrane protein HdeD (DUF308 family)